MAEEVTAQRGRRLLEGGPQLAARPRERLTVLRAERSLGRGQGVVNRLRPGLDSILGLRAAASDRPLGP
jgi:hypothetical protein